MLVQLNDQGVQHACMKALNQDPAFSEMLTQLENAVRVCACCVRCCPKTRPDADVLRRRLCSAVPSPCPTCCRRLRSLRCDCVCADSACGLQADSALDVQEAAVAQPQPEWQELGIEENLKLFLDRCAAPCICAVVQAVGSRL